MVWDEIADKRGRHKSRRLVEGLANSFLGDDPGLCMGGGVGGGLEKMLGRKRRVVSQKREWLEIYTRERVTMKDAQAYQ